MVFLRRFALFTLIPAVFAGCSSEAPIITYEIPTTVPAAFATEDTRMVAAIVPQEKQAWFFKLMGRKSAIDSVADDFRNFVETVDFEEGVPVLADLPQGWRMGGQRAMRFASIDIDTPTQQLDLSVSQLSRMEDWDKLVVMNVNRWRGQVGLEDSDEKWASGEKLDREPIAGEGEEEVSAIWIDVTGRPKSDGNPMGSMAGAPFAGRKPPFANMGSPDAGDQGFEDPAADPHAGLPREAREAIASGKMKAPGPVSAAGPIGGAGSVAAAGSDGGKTKPAKADKSSEPESKLKFDRPEGWRDGRMSMMRMAAFNVGPEDQQAEVTVITAGGDLRGNVARWMGQIRKGQVPDEEVDEALKNAEKLKVDGREAQRFVLLPEASDEPDDDSDEEATATAIDATIVPIEDGFSLFIKMTGPANVIEEQSDQMKAFITSLQF